MSILNFLKLFLSVLSVLVLSSCSLEINPPNIPLESETIENPIIDKDYSKQGPSLKDEIIQQSKVNKIEDWEGLKAFLGNNLSSGSSNLNNIWSEPMTSESTQPSSAYYSETHTQVSDVGETDTLKTDGRYIYTLSATSIFIIAAYPSSGAKILAEIKFKNQPSEFFIANNRLIVIDNDLVQKNNYSYLKIFDTSDKNNPKEIRHLDIEGAYVDSRLIGDYLYFISSADSFSYANRDSMLPEILENDKNIDCGFVDECSMPNIYYFDMPYSTYNLTTISSVNIQSSENDIKREFYILPDSKNVFVSDDNVYLTYTKYLSERQLETETMIDLIYSDLNEGSKQKIKSIKIVENFILDEYEKQNKIRSILEYHINLLDVSEQKSFQQNLEQKMIEKYRDIIQELEMTVIHKIKLTKGDIEYQVSGEVAGRVLNQFFMSEKDDDFFIATTKNQFWPPYTNEQNISTNNFYALNGDMELLGDLTGLVEGEKIHSLRFMQDRAYIVTFEKPDLFFVIDLSEAKELKILGELRMPGFSDYLHPYDNNTLISLGRDVLGDEQGDTINRGVKLSLFDVSDVYNPSEIDSQILGGVGSDSMALNDYEAFTFSKDKSLLTIPILIKNSKKGIFGNQDFDGAILFNVNTQGFSLKGLVDHENLIPSAQGERSIVQPNDHQGIRRTLYINDVLYTFSDYGLNLSSLKNLNTLKSFSFIDTVRGINLDYTVNTY